MNDSVLGAVLAGGRSRRMGGDKALLRLGGRTLLERAYGTLREVFDEVVVVGRGGDDPGLPAIPDRIPDLGPLGGLHTALEAAAGRGVFVLACDLPFVGPELVRHVASSPVPRAAAGGADAVARVATLDGRAQPLCGLYSAACAAVVEGAVVEGVYAMHEVLLRLRTVRVALTADLPFYRPDLLLNLNRPEDLERARSGAAERARPVR